MKTTIRCIRVLFVMLFFVACSNDEADPATEFTIASFTPDSGTVGTRVTIAGTGFPEDLADLEVTIGGAPASIVSVSPTQIVAEVLSGATSGEVRVSANGFTASATATFEVLSDLVAQTVSNLEAPQTGGQGEPIGGVFTKFSFETGTVTDSETAWDIAFRGTTIAVNGGAATGTADEPVRNGDAAASIENGTFSEVSSADGLSFIQDADGAFAIPAGSDQGWYNYNPATFTVTPIPGKILVFRTHDGKYAKVEILSYYRDAPAQPDAFTDESRVYTFRYVYNPNDGETNLAQ